MGSFDQACLASRLQVSNWLSPDCYILPIVNQSKFLNLSDGPYLYWKPICIPIKGKYDDYGGITDIEVNWSTKQLEEYFNLPIQAIVECICSTRKRNTFEYTELNVILKAYNINITSEINRRNLRTLGFKITKSGIITHPLAPSAPKYTLKGNQVLYTFDGHHCSHRYLEEVCKAFEKDLDPNYKRPYYFGVPQKLQSRVGLLQQLSPAFIKADVWDSIITIMGKDLTTNTLFQKSIQDAENRFRLLTEQNNLEPSKDTFILLSRSIFLKDLRFFRGFGPNVLSYKYKDPSEVTLAIRDLTNLAYFTEGLHALNVLVTPTQSLTQCGERDVQLKIMKDFVKLAKQEIYTLEQE